MSGMSPERLAEIRANLPDPSADLSRRERDSHALLAHVDHLTAENARLRDGIEALADAHCLHDKYAYALLHGDDVQTLLNPPTEGETK